jgi:uncharacterized sulfatase
MITYSLSTISLLFIGIIWIGCSDEDDAAADKRPNILFCISDDQSWVHTSINGDPVVKTPNFDRIAREGLIFTNSYTNAPSCAPSRAAILTGQNFWQLEEGGLLFGRLKKKYPIFTNLLEKAGYEIAKTGKGYGPANQEFDDTWKNPCGENWSPLSLDLPYTQELSEDEEGVTEVNYAANFAAFLNGRDKSKPFFFWFGGYEPHRDYVFKSGESLGLDPGKVDVPSFLPEVEEIRHDICDYLFEIEWFDQHLGKMLKILEDLGEIENTLIVVTSDNGMPFPRAKATVYEYGVHMPLAISWKDGIKNPGRIIDDFVNHIDFAPTFLEVAGIEVPKEMTGRSLRKMFTNNRSGFVDPERSMTVTGIERHVWARPDGKTYPRRAIHTDNLVYIRNYESHRWPMGDPDFEASHQDVFGDIDAGPTKKYMMEHQKKDSVKELFAMSFGKLPAEEIYDIKKDPAQMNNLADDPDYSWLKKMLKKDLEEYQKKTGDPRVFGQSPWDDYPFYAGEKYLKGQYLEEVLKLRN